MQTYTVCFDELGLTERHIFEAMGYGEAPQNPHIEEIVRALLADIREWVNPLCAFQIYEGTHDRTTVTIEGTVLDTNTVIAAMMRGATHYAVFVATAGVEFENWMHNLKAKDDMIVTFVADSIGSCLVECVGDKMEKILEQQLNGMNYTNRFSPGYCRWPLMEQQKLFALLEPEPCNIKLSEVCLMNPIKSISGIIGIGAEVKRKEYSCGLCEMTDCFRRKLKH